MIESDRDTQTDGLTEIHTQRKTGEEFMKLRQRKFKREIKIRRRGGGEDIDNVIKLRDMIEIEIKQRHI